MSAPTIVIYARSVNTSFFCGLFEIVFDILEECEKDPS